MFPGYKSIKSRGTGWVVRGSHVLVRPSQSQYIHSNTGYRFSHFDPLAICFLKWPGLPSPTGVLVTRGECGSDTLVSGDNKVGITGHGPWSRLVSTQYTRWHNAVHIRAAKIGWKYFLDISFFLLSTNDQLPSKWVISPVWHNRRVNLEFLLFPISLHCVRASQWCMNAGLAW